MPTFEHVRVDRGVDIRCDVHALELPAHLRLDQVPHVHHATRPRGSGAAQASLVALRRDVGSIEVISMC
jgi:hypothetical protein